MLRFSSWLFTGASAACLIFAGMPAAAQATDPTLGEVVVTGQRRESTVQNTAAVIDVLSAEKLQRAGVNGNMGLQFQTPGLLISQDQLLTTQVYIRGIGSNLLGVAVSNSVATYIDGVYISNPLQAGQSYSDVERVEVLKGPQATLYGRNATGGAINVITAEPSFQFGGSGSVEAGNYHAWRAMGNVSGPILGDKIAGRLAIQLGGHEGYTRNLFLGTRVGGDRTWGLRGGLKFVLEDNLDVVVRADYLDQRGSDSSKLLPAAAAYYTGIPQYFTSNPRAFYGDLDN
jgi:iron complex outermembrane recepter protein